MKLRNGFVSNSSSSSFVLIGNQVGFNEVKFEKGRKFYAIGEYIEEGQNVWQLSNADLKKIQEKKAEDSFKYYEVFFYTEYGGGEFIRPGDLPESGAQVICGTVDQASGLQYAFDTEY